MIKKNIYKIIVVIIVTISVVLIVRFSSPEDDWICVDNVWVKHGNPSSNPPVSDCGKTQTTNQQIKLYYYNPKLDQGVGGILCSRKGLVAVDRTVLKTITPIQDTIKLLLKGEISSTEKAQGVTTEFPLEGVSLTGANLENGELTLSFSDPQNKTSGGSCRAGILWFQIEATAKQFSEVKSVKFIPEKLFQP